MHNYIVKYDKNNRFYNSIKAHFYLILENQTFSSLWTVLIKEPDSNIVMVLHNSNNKKSMEEQYQKILNKYLIKDWKLIEYDQISENPNNKIVSEFEFDGRLL